MSVGTQHLLKGNLQVTSCYGSNTIQTDDIGNISISGSLDSKSGGMMFRNRIINGNMIVDQRNSGALSSAITATTTYALDRWYGGVVGGGAIKFQQVSVPAPLSGFSKCMKITVSTADAAIAASDYAVFGQRIEGYNVMDMNFGDSYAKPFTLSFWIYSSAIGTMGVRFANSALNRSYMDTFTISVANTWTFIKLTAVGDTTGTWDKTNAAGLVIDFTLMSGTTYQSALTKTWSGAAPLTTSAQTNFMSSVANTIYLTGVQLECGTTATSFEFRPYSAELRLCQRYYESMTKITLQCALGTSSRGMSVAFKETKRAMPTVSVVQTGGNPSYDVNYSSVEAAYITSTTGDWFAAGVKADAELL